MNRRSFIRVLGAFTVVPAAWALSKVFGVGQPVETVKRRFGLIASQEGDLDWYVDTAKLPTPTQSIAELVRERRKAAIEAEARYLEAYYWGPMETA